MAHNDPTSPSARRQHLWREALGPGFAVGPSERMVWLVAALAYAAHNGK